MIEDAYNHGESNQFSVCIDAARANGARGWFFIETLDTGRILTPKPQLNWTSPTDLLVTVRTDDLEGQTVRQLGEFGEPRGSLTIRYLADSPRT